MPSESEGIQEVDCQSVNLPFYVKQFKHIEDSDIALHSLQSFSVRAAL